MRNDPDKCQARDPDFELLPMFESCMKKAFVFKKVSFFESFRANSYWLTPHTVGDYACPNCIAQSLRQYGHIILLKSWRYVSAPICPLHSIILTNYGTRDPSYLQFLTGPSTPLRLTVSGSALATIIKIGLKVQIMMLKLEKQMIANFYDSNPRKPSMFHARKFIMEFFLHAANFGGGVATQFITTPRASDRALSSIRFTLLMKIGALQANAAERTCGLIMMGIVTGCITRQEIDELDAETKSASSWWGCRWDPESIGESCNQIYSSHEQIQLRQLRNVLSVFKHNNTKAFMKGMNLDPL
jgi:hypothetical protein